MQNLRPDRRRSPPSADTLVCADGRCQTATVAAEGFAIEYTQEPSEWRQCRTCGKAWVYIDEGDVGCLPGLRRRGAEAAQAQWEDDDVVLPTPPGH